MNSEWSANATAYIDRPKTQEWRFSVEFFPARNALGRATLSKTVKELSALAPEFYSVTSGAGGSTRDLTAENVQWIVNLSNNKNVAPHVTCIDQSKWEVEQIIDDYLGTGVNHIVALRGDSQKEPCIAENNSYRSAADLVKAIRNKSNCKVSVAGYPERHPEAMSWEQEIQYLKHKLDQGANQIITQFFFDTEVFVQFMDRVIAAGITVPVLPGILPIQNFHKAVAFSKRCGTQIPRWYHTLFDGLEENSLLHREISTSIATEQIRQLMGFGIKDFHFYSLNQSDLILGICNELNKFANVRQDVKNAAGF